MSNVIPLFPVKPATDLDGAIETFYQAAKVFGAPREMAEFVCTRLNDIVVTVEAEIKAAVGSVISWPTLSDDQARAEEARVSIRGQLDRALIAQEDAYRQQVYAILIELWYAMYPPGDGGGRKVA